MDRYPPPSDIDTAQCPRASGRAEFACDVYEALNAFGQEEFDAYRWATALHDRHGRSSRVALEQAWNRFKRALREYGAFDAGAFEHEPRGMTLRATPKAWPWLHDFLGGRARLTAAAAQVDETTRAVECRLECQHGLDDKGFPFFTIVMVMKGGLRRNLTLQGDDLTAFFNRVSMLAEGELRG